MGIVPWNVIAAGRLRSDAEEQRREESGEGGRALRGRDWRRTEVERSASNALEKVGKELGTNVSVSAGRGLRSHSGTFPDSKCFSRNRVCYAQSPVRVPSSRRSKSRTPSREYQSAFHFSFTRTGRILG